MLLVITGVVELAACYCSTQVTTGPQRHFLRSHGSCCSQQHRSNWRQNITVN